MARKQTAAKAGALSSAFCHHRRIPCRSWNRQTGDSPPKFTPAAVAVSLLERSRPAPLAGSHSASTLRRIT
jgi:hypothetical protein